MPLAARQHEGFRDHPTISSKVVCELCEKYGETSNIARKTVTGHLQTVKHRACAQLDMAAQANKARLEAQYSHIQAASLEDGALTASNAHPPAEAWTAFLPNDVNGVSGWDFDMDVNGDDVQFTAGNEIDVERERNQYYSDLQDFTYQHDYSGLHFQDDDATLSQLVREMEDAGLYGDEDAGDVQARLFGSMRNQEWAPYNSKTMALIDLMDNLPRMRLSDAQLRMVLFIMRESGAKDVPSLYALRQVQEKLQKAAGTQTLQYKSVLGNVFFANNVCEIIAKDYANPVTARAMTFYPKRKTTGPLTDACDFSRWTELPWELLSPMAVCGTTHFYVKELAELVDHTLVIPQIWFEGDSGIEADCYQVVQSQDGLMVATERMITVPVTRFRSSFPELAAADIPIIFAGSSRHLRAQMPNPLRVQARGLEMYTSFVHVWADDVSGNVSKQYNKHYNLYGSHTNLPATLLDQEFFVHLISTSPHASSAEQFEAVSQQIKQTHTEPVVTYNASSRQECMFRLVLPCLPGDNPQQSDDCSHIGHNGSHPCRRCYIGGSAQQRVSNEGYHALFSPGRMRNVEETRTILQEQLDAAMLGVAASVNDLETSTGIKDKICRHYINELLARAKELQKQGIGQEEITAQLHDWLENQPGDHYNPLLMIPGLDPHQDTPVEILHTVLLGIVKYAWHGMWSNWPDKGPQFETFTLRLQSTNLDGLRVPPIRAAYMQQYKNGLIGKHFKTLMQTAVFHVHGLVSTAQFTLLKAIGELGAVLWISVIIDLAQYLRDLSILIDNVLEAFTAMDPTRILQKIKIHILEHLPADIARFGPAVRFATEVFECYNAIFRMCSVLSNHQAPSRDIGIKCSHMDRVKHILSGGYWKDGDAWVQASTDVLSLLASKPCIQAHLGWVPRVDLEIGMISRPPVKERQCLSWAETHSSRASLPNGYCIPAASKWDIGAAVIASNEDKCRVNAWVVCRSHDGSLLIGRIQELLAAHDAQAQPLGIVLIEPFQLSDQLHVDFSMPVLTRSHPTSRIILSHMDIQFCINVQHDCRTALCKAGDGPTMRQERQDTETVTRVIIHKDDGRFIINTHALHNASRLRNVLPRHLIAPRRLVDNPRALHDTLAAELRITQTVRRAEINAKTQKTKEANKRKKMAEKAGDKGEPGVQAPQVSDPGTELAGPASAVPPEATHHTAGARKRPRND